jgi:hypothetical protein
VDGSARVQRFSALVERSGSALNGKPIMNDDRDWKSELPFMAWSESHIGERPSVKLARGPDGRWGYLTVDGDVIPDDDPRVADYTAARAKEWLFASGEQIRNRDEIIDSIEDLDNAEPFPRWFRIKRPKTFAWLTGQNPDYAPTEFEETVLLSAYHERLRRLKEMGLLGRDPGDGDQQNSYSYDFTAWPPDKAPKDFGEAVVDPPKPITVIRDKPNRPNPAAGSGQRKAVPPYKEGEPTALTGLRLWNEGKTWREVAEAIGDDNVPAVADRVKRFATAEGCT